MASLSAEMPSQRRGLFAFLSGMLPRRLSIEEKAELDEARARQLMLQHKQRELARQAGEFARLISHTLDNHGISYVYKTRGTRNFTQVVKFRKPYRANEELVMLQVDTRPGRLPHGVGLKQLEDPDILRLLSINCRHRVRVKFTAEGGFWFFVDRKYGVGGIPLHVQFEKDMMAARKANTHPLAIPIGIGEYKAHIWRRLDEFTNLMVCGTIGAGKSVFLNAMICSLIRYNSPQRLKFVLIDLKGGMEFNVFHKLPHVMQLPRLKFPVGRIKSEQIGAQEEEQSESGLEPEQLGISMDALEMDKQAMIPAVFEEREQVPAVLAWLIREGERRMELLKEKKSSKLGHYNNHVRPEHRLPHIVCVIDEWADVKLDQAVGRQAEEMLINATSRLRAVGIHMIVCTQSPNKDVLNLRLRNVLPARLVFQCPDRYMSQTLIGSDLASEINRHGNGYFVYGNYLAQVQCPFIPPATVEEYVRQAQAGKVEGVKADTDITDEEIFDWAITENGGALDWRSLFNEFRGRGLSAAAAKSFPQEYSGKLIERSDGNYIVTQPANGKGAYIPWRLMPVEGSLPAEEPGMLGRGDDSRQEDVAPPAESPEVTFMAHCLKCKQSREIVKAQPATTKSGKPMLRGTCSACGMTVQKFVKASNGHS